MTTKPENTTTFQNADENISLDEIFRRIDEAGPDPDQPSLEEISQIVKEGRTERYNYLIYGERG